MPQNSLKSPAEYGYVIKNNLCLWQKGPLSQWYGAYPGQKSSFVEDNGRGRTNTFNCAEQYMMAGKADCFNDDETLEKIMKSSNPKEQKQLGRLVKGYDEEQWRQFRLRWVIRGNKLKFDQNPHLREFLLSFHKHTIFAEAAPWDKIWGIGMGPENPDSLDIYKWKGENLLGLAIGSIRKSYE